MSSFKNVLLDLYFKTNICRWRKVRALQNMLNYQAAWRVFHSLFGCIHTTASQKNPSYESGKWMKVKVVKWCWKSERDLF